MSHVFSSFRMSVMSDTQNSPDSVEFSSSATCISSSDSSPISATFSVTTVNELTSSASTDGDVVESGESETASEMSSQSHTSSFSKSSSNESDTSYTSFEKARFTLYTGRIPIDHW